MNCGIIIALIFVVLIIAISLIFVFAIKPKLDKCYHPPAPVPAPALPIIIPPASCPTYSIIANKNINGYNLSGMPVNNTETQCQTLCTTTPECEWYTYDNPTNQCWLNQGIKENNIITGFRIRDNPVNNTSCKQWYRIIGVNISGYNMTNLSGNPFKDQTEQSCQKICAANNCDWYTFDKFGNVCYLNQASNNSGMEIGLPVNILLTR